jgi:hypothetical protein
MSKQYFEVSAQWMAACGHGAAAQIFPVKTVDTNAIGGRGFDAFAILDTSGFPAMYATEWTVAVARGRFVDSALPDGAHIGSYNKGRAIGYSDGTAFVLSFPASLNSNGIPAIDDMPGILAGQSVAAAARAFNESVTAALADKINAECLDWLPLPNNDADEFILRADEDGVFIVDGATDERIKRVSDSWMMRPRVNLAKPEPVALAACACAAPCCESNAVVMARAVEFVRDRRLTAEYVAATHGDDNDSDDECTACVRNLQGDIVELCDECEQNAPEFVNYYRCPACNHEWDDVWTAQCDDDCPECGQRHISPYNSEDAE